MRTKGLGTMRGNSYDVAIVGGGPAGSTAGTLLKKYNPDLKVAIFEREVFPREHVGESQLSPIGAILNEMGCWDKVEAAQFPIKVGATYRWGSSPDLWDFDFIPDVKFIEEPRPAKYQGARVATAFQVERATYDKILLDHARELGCEVHEGSRVARIAHENDTINHLVVDKIGEVKAKYYLDCTGHVGVLRRQLGVGVTVPTALKNMAMWDYWENTDWAVEIGVGGTRVQVLSLGCGWIWFIPLGPTRTSIGFICPVEYYKKSGQSIAELYQWAVETEPRVRELTQNATREQNVRSTKDWSFVADRMHGKNWFLVGESGGFADPVLAGGMTLTHMGAREVAYLILETERGTHDVEWMKQEYADAQDRRIRQYIRFADFWYASNGQFTDLRDFTAKIAKDAGFDLSPEQAFRWLSFGGFAHEDPFLPGLGGLDLNAVRWISSRFTTGDEFQFEFSKYNVLKPNFTGARKETMALFHSGRVLKTQCYRRKGRVLPIAGYYQLVLDAIRKHTDITKIIKALNRERFLPTQFKWKTPARLGMAISTLESLVQEGWVVGELDESKPRLKPLSHLRDFGNTNMHHNDDGIGSRGVQTDRVGEEPASMGANATNGNA